MPSWVTTDGIFVDMTRKSIAIGIPTFGTVSMRWALAYQNLALPMNAKVARIVEQGFEVGVARNKIVVQVLAMEPRPSHIFFIDDDVIPATPWPLLRLLQHDVDIVSGIYFTKGEHSEPLAFRPPGEGVETYDPRRGLVPVWGIGMGLTLTRTDVFQKVLDEVDLGTDDLGNPKWFYTSGDKPGEPPITEDLYFCQQAAKVGITPHVDMSPEAFGWHYDSQNQVGFPRCQWEAYLKTGAVSWEVPDDGDSSNQLRDSNRVPERHEPELDCVEHDSSDRRCHEHVDLAAC